jgi:hypothetical protein
MITDLGDAVELAGIETGEVEARNATARGWR